MKVAWTYYLTRDTNSSGELCPLIGVWYRKPIRRKLSFDKGYAWIPSDPPKDMLPPEGIAFDTGYYGEYTTTHCMRVFGTIPDTDLEVIVCEQVRDDGAN